MRIDLKKDFPDRYRPPAGRFVEIDLPELAYLAVDGHGDPNTTPLYGRAVASLYAVGYAVRAVHKQRTGSDFVVGPLEGLWSSADPRAFVSRAKDNWDWTMLIPLPTPVTGADVERGLEAAARKVAAKKQDPPLLDVRLVTLLEGWCLQTLHIGSYDEEGPILAVLHEEVMPGMG